METHTMGNWTSIIRQMPDCPLSVTIYPSISQYISLSICLSSVLSNFCFYPSHEVILFISTPIHLNTSYLLLLYSSSLPHHIPTMSAIKFSSHCFILPFNLLVFTVSIVSYMYPKTQVFTSFVFN